MTDVLLCLFHLYKTCQFRKNSRYPHKGPKHWVKTDHLFLLWALIAFRDTEAVWLPTHFGRPFYGEGHVCSYPFIRRKENRGYSKEWKQCDSTNMLCDYPLREGSVHTPGQMEKMNTSLRVCRGCGIKQAWPMCDCRQHSFPFWDVSNWYKDRMQ